MTTSQTQAIKDYLSREKTAIKNISNDIHNKKQFIKDSYKELNPLIIQCTQSYSKELCLKIKDLQSSISKTQSELHYMRAGIGSRSIFYAFLKNYKKPEKANSILAKHTNRIYDYLNESEFDFNYTNKICLFCGIEFDLSGEAK